MDKRLIAVRIRGSVNVNRDIEETLGLLGLKRVNNAVLIDNRPSYKGMLQTAKDYITWGEADVESVSTVLKNRGEVVGNEKLTDAFVKANSKFKSIEDFSKAFVEFKAELKDLKGLKKVFRLHPPRKGHSGIKKAYTTGGSLGNRKTEIKGLIRKMR